MQSLALVIQVFDTKQPYAPSLGSLTCPDAAATTSHRSDDMARLIATSTDLEDL
jgi:hypothetical protein